MKVELLSYCYEKDTKRRRKALSARERPSGDWQRTRAFAFSDTVGKGPRYGLLRGGGRELERFITDEELRRGYQHVATPDIAKIDLYKKSGITHTTKNQCTRR